LGAVTLELPFQFPDVLRLKVPNQTNGGLSALRILFNLQCPLASDIGVNASGVPTQLIESVALNAREVVEVSGNPESSENRESVVAARGVQRQGKELMKRGIRCGAVN